MIRTIWNMGKEDFNSDDWKMAAMETCECNNITVSCDGHFEDGKFIPDYFDVDLEEMAEEIYRDYLDDERCNLDKELPGTIVAIGTIGRWDGDYSGYREIGSNINECLVDYDCPDWLCNWYCDDDNFCFEGSHHDGTNYYTYRLVTDMDMFENASSDEEMLELSESIRPYIAEVYGW